MSIPKDFKGAARPITSIDIARIAHVSNLGEDHIHAFMDVEAAGKPFDSKGRPKMLFEPHRFYAELGAGAKRDAAVKAGLARRTWKIGGKPPKYPSDSYPKLTKAMEIDEAAALKACSWGLSQILGKWHADIGYKTVQDMVAAFCEDADTHLEATIRLLKSWKIDDDLRAQRWEKVAEVWNGPSYKSHGYHKKLAARFAWWQKKPDTVYDPNKVSIDIKGADADALKRIENAVKEVKVGTESPEKASKDTVARVQKLLYDLGYTEVGSMRSDGTFDGVFGKLTKAAILAFQLDNDLTLSGEINDELIVALAKAKPRDLPRNDATEKTVRENVPEVKSNWFMKIGAFLVGIPAMIGGLFDGVVSNLGVATGYIEPVREAFGDVPGWVWFLAIAGIAGGVYLVSQRGEASGVAAYKSGERR